MHSKTIILALTMGISCLAAPLAVPKTTESGEITTQGWGQVRREAGSDSPEITTQGWGQVRREAEAESNSEAKVNGWGQVRNAESSESGTVHTNGWGQVRKDTIEKRTGYGIISGGTDEA